MLVVCAVQYRCLSAEDRLQQLKTALMEPFWTKDLNVQILALVAKDLNPGTRDTRYKPPFSVCAKNVMSSPESYGEIC